MKFIIWRVLIDRLRGCVLYRYIEFSANLNFITINSVYKYWLKAVNKAMANFSKFIKK